MVDVGCGIGGSSRHIAAKYGCTARGITLSPVQAARANALAARVGLADKCSFQVADALAQPFEDGSFDLVWSMESGEHMPEKPCVFVCCRFACSFASCVCVPYRPQALCTYANTKLLPV
jgi:cyclopropane fatty-acyl-phospholipid synthase-like methyltransferase